MILDECQNLDRCQTVLALWNLKASGKTWIVSCTERGRVGGGEFSIFVILYFNFLFSILDLKTRKEIPPPVRNHSYGIALLNISKSFDTIVNIN